MEAGTATLGVGVGKALGGLSKGVKGAAKTASKATTSSIETGGGAVVSNISKGEALRIQNAATKINKTISVVGSRAAGKAGAYSDWDYVIKGLTNKQWKSVKNSLPGSKSIMDNTPRNIDIHQPPLQVDKPYIMFHPKK